MSRVYAEQISSCASSPPRCHEGLMSRLRLSRCFTPEAAHRCPGIMRLCISHGRASKSPRDAQAARRYCCNCALTHTPYAKQGAAAGPRVAFDTRAYGARGAENVARQIRCRCCALVETPLPQPETPAQRLGLRVLAAAQVPSGAAGVRRLFCERNRFREFPDKLIDIMR